MKTTSKARDFFCAANQSLGVIFLVLGLATRAGAQPILTNRIYDLAEDFSTVSNPNGVWSYGGMSSIAGSFVLLTASGNSSWNLAPGAQPEVQTSPATGELIVDSGTQDSPLIFGVVRFTVPNGGAGKYLLQTRASLKYAGADSDFHVVKNGVEIYGVFMPTSSATGYTNSFDLVEGDTIDFMVGRGADGVESGSGSRIEATLTYIPAFLTTGLVAYYPFNRNANDASGNGNNASLIGTNYVFTSDAACAISNGTCIDAGKLFPPTQDTLTESCWVKSTQQQEQLAAPYFKHIPLMTRRTGTTYSGGWATLEINNQGYLALTVDDDNYGNECQNTNYSSISVFDGTWHHVVGVKSNNLYSLYLDGQAIATITDFHMLSASDDTRDFWIGRHSWNYMAPLETSDLDASLRHVRVYNRALSDSEVQQLYAYESAIGSAPIILQQPQDKTVIEGTNVTIGLTVTGTQPMTIQWQFNGTNILGATSTSLILTNVQLEDGGTYTATITNSLGGVMSDPATLTVLTAPRITVQPKGQIAYWGKAVTFSVAARGSRPLSYQWFKDGFIISWATNSTLSLTNLDLFAGADYFVVVSNSVNSVTSNPALLVLNAAGIALGLYPGVMIDGVAGKTYGIQYTLDVTRTNSWTSLTNLVHPVSLYLDS